MRLLPPCLVALALIGCGDQTSISGGGRVAGDTLTVYSFLPRTDAAREIELGEKLALMQAHGRVGEHTVNFVARELPAEPDAIATAVREVVLDQGVIAVLGDLDSRTARITVPLFDAAGILHVSPGASGTGFANPSGRKTYGSLVPDDNVQAHAVAELLPGPLAVEAEGSEAAQRLADAVAAEAGHTVPLRRARTVFYAGSDPVNAEGVVADILVEHPRVRVLMAQELALTELPERFVDEPRVRFVTAIPAPPPEFEAAFRIAYPGREPTVLAGHGWSAMNEILATLAAAGKDARSRRAVIEGYMARPHPANPLRIIR